MHSFSEAKGCVHWSPFGIVDSGLNGSQGRVIDVLSMSIGANTGMPWNWSTQIVPSKASAVNSDSFR